MASSQTRKGLSLAGQAFFGSLCAGTFGLGVWQTQRYFEKDKLVEQRANDLSQEPVCWDDLRRATTDDNRSSNFRRIRLKGRFDHAHEFLVGPRGPPQGALPDKPGTSAAGMSSAPQGYFVVTPLVLQPFDSQQNKSEGDVVLVNRGWVPRQLVQPDHGRRRSQQLPWREQGESLLLQWNRPVDTVQLTVVRSEPERPKSFLVAQHDLQQRPPRLFWFDRIAMHVAGGVPLLQENSNKSSLETTRNATDTTVTAPLVTVVRDDPESSSKSTWPGCTTA